MTKTKELEKEVKKETIREEKPVDEVKEIQVIERIIENREIAPTDAFGKLTRAQVQLIKSTIAKGASDDELRLFIQVCKGANLNPFLKQVFLVPRWDSTEAKQVRAIQVSIDGFRSIAESSGVYAGNDDPIFEEGDTIKYGKEKETVKVPSTAKVTVYKIVGGQRYPFTATARWNEYYPGEKMGFQWHQRPYLMLGKCAEALALRKAFPKLLSGMYAQEEMDKGTMESTEDQKQNQAFTKLIHLIKTSTVEELREYKKKMNASAKYTEDQKSEFTKLADARITELLSSSDIIKQEKESEKTIEA